MVKIKKDYDINSVENGFTARVTTYVNGDYKGSEEFILIDKKDVIKFLNEELD